MSGADYAIIGSMIATLVGLPMTLVVTYLRSMHNDQRSFKDAVNKRLDAQDGRFRELESGKVDRTEWGREAIRVQDKMDHVSEQIAGVAAKLDAQFGPTPALNRIAEALESKTVNDE